MLSNLCLSLTSHAMSCLVLFCPVLRKTGLLSLCTQKSHVMSRLLTHGKYFTRNGKWGPLSHFQECVGHLYVVGVLLLLVLDFAVLCDLFKLLSSMWQQLCTPKSDAVSRHVVRVEAATSTSTYPPYYPPFITCLRYLPSKLPLCIPAVNKSL